MKQNGEIFFRKAQPLDIENIVNLELDIWGKEGANKNKISNRINTFPRGNLVADWNGSIVGYLSYEHVDDKRVGGAFTWAQITDNGTMCNSHVKNGEYAYGVNLTVGKKAQCMNLGEALMLYGMSDVIEDNKKGSFLGSRMPGFRNYSGRHPNVTADEYMRLKWRGRVRDSELRFYESLGFQVIRVLPDYFPDPESLDCGVLLFFANNLYMSEERELIAKAMKTEAKGMIKYGRR
ncbi:MAG: hypothetical protein WC823_03315 [Parcubacteria group bacterium]|jgi:ribosomal protein S18 acetylase RimI-like enzyme